MRCRSSCRPSQGAANFHAAAYAEGQPSSTEVNNIWTSGVGNVKNAFASTPSNVQGIGTVSMSDPSNASGAAHTFSTNVDFTENAASFISSTGLIGGMLTSPLNGTGLGSGDSLHFRIVPTRHDADRPDLDHQHRCSELFPEHGVRSGHRQNPLGGGNPDVQFVFDLTSSHPGNGLASNFLLGTTTTSPEAGTWTSATGGSWADCRRIRSTIRSPMARARARFLPARSPRRKPSRSTRTR